MIVAVVVLDAPPHALQREVDEMVRQEWVQRSEPDRAAKSAIPGRKSISLLRPPANGERCWGGTRVQRKRRKAICADEILDVDLSEAEPEPPVKKLRSWDRHDEGQGSSRRGMSDSFTKRTLAFHHHLPSGGEAFPVYIGFICEVLRRYMPNCMK